MSHPDHQPPPFADRVLAWDGERLTAELLQERHAARSDRCPRESRPLWEDDAPQHGYERSHRNLETRLAELDARLEREQRTKPRQIGIREIAKRIRFGEVSDDVTREFPIYGLAMPAVAYFLAVILFGGDLPAPRSG